MFKLTNGPSVLRILDGASIPADPANSNFAEYQRWLAEGNTPEPVDPPTQDQVLSSVTSAIQKNLDDFARTRNYDGILSACTYATSTVPKFAAEGQYCVQARDATWAAAYVILAAVEAGTRPMPTLEHVLSELPILSWS